MASQRTLPYFPTLVKRYDTRSRGIYGRAALPGRKHRGPGKPAQPGDTRRPSGARAVRLDNCLIAWSRRPSYCSCRCRRSENETVIDTALCSPWIPTTSQNHWHEVCNDSSQDSGIDRAVLRPLIVGTGSASQAERPPELTSSPRHDHRNPSGTRPGSDGRHIQRRQVHARLPRCSRQDNEIQIAADERD